MKKCDRCGSTAEGSDCYRKFSSYQLPEREQTGPFKTYTTKFTDLCNNCVEILINFMSTKPVDTKQLQELVNANPAVNPEKIKELCSTTTLKLKKNLIETFLNWCLDLVKKKA